MAIRYDSSLNAEIRRTVANFNKKVRRLERTEQEIIPETTSVKELKEIYKDRRQLRRKLKQLRKFSERGMEKVIITPGGVEMTQWEYETGRADYIMVKRRLAREVRMATTKLPSPYLKSEHIQNTIDRLEEMKYFRDLTPLQYQIAMNIVDKSIKTGYYEETFKINLIRKFETIVKEKGYSEDIVVRLQRFSGEELLKIYNDSLGLSTIMEFADTLGMTNVTQLKSQAHKGATLDKSNFDDIVEGFVNNLSIYEKTYKK